MSNLNLELELELETKKGYYTRDELRNHVKNNIFFEVKPYTSNGQVKNITNEINFWDIVNEVHINGKPINFKTNNMLIPEYIEFLHGKDN